MFYLTKLPRLSLIVLIVVALVGVTSYSAYASQDTCSTMVFDALTAVGDSCEGIGRNQACYGNLILSATPRDPDASLVFSAPGDKVSVVEVESLQLSGLAPDESEWGIAVMALQANLPDSLPGQNATFVLFGDVQIENLAHDPSSSESTPTPVAPDAPQYGPMQAFRLRTGIGTLSCSEAPASGILIQTPEGAGKVDFEINGVQIALGSTVAVRAVWGDSMRIALIEGQADLTVLTRRGVIRAGRVAIIQLDANGNPTGEYTIEDAAPSDTANLPLDLLTTLALPVASPTQSAGDFPLGTFLATGSGTYDDCLIASDTFPPEVPDIERPVGAHYNRDGVLVVREQPMQQDADGVWRPITPDPEYPQEFTVTGGTVTGTMGYPTVDHDSNPCVVMYTVTLTREPE